MRFIRLLAPLSLLFAALLCSGVMVFGVSPVIGSWSRSGVHWVLLSYRLQLPLAVVSVMFCLSVVALVAIGRRRAWWLLGLLPTLALFGNRFVVHKPVLTAIENPAFVDIDHATFVVDSDMVVGLTRDHVDYAFSFAALHQHPVVVMADRAGVMVLLWSSMANRALAFSAARELHARDLQVVASPVDTLFVFNSRLGQFINGVTGKTPDGITPSDFEKPITIEKMNWANWHVRHPNTLVMVPADDTWRTAPADADAPRFKLPASAAGTPAHFPDTRRVCMIACTQPIAVPDELISDRPMNLTHGNSSILLVKINGEIRAYDRQLPLDLIPSFKPVTDPKHKSAVWIDSDTNSEWSANGMVVQGPPEMMHTQLSPVPCEDAVYQELLQYWYPDLHVTTAAEAAAAVHVDPPPAATRPVNARRRKKPAR